MKKINWSVRKKHFLFWIGLIGVIGNTALQYFGMAASDLTSWSGFLDVVVDTIKNPYLSFSIIAAVMSAIGVAADPTTAGLGDSKQALTYPEPKED